MVNTNARAVLSNGNLNSTTGVTVNNGGALELQNNITVNATALTLNGTGIASGGAKNGAGSIEQMESGLTKRFWGYLVVVLLFTLGNSTDAFLLLRANQLGVPIALAPMAL